MVIPFKNLYLVEKCQTICNDCAFHTLVEEAIMCIHPDESGVNCSTVIFCNSFEPALIIDSPCVTYGNDEK
nr:hypothetical protein [Nostoc sp. LPT]